MAKITTIISEIKKVYPIAHDSFETPQTLPFTCWTDQGSTSFYADSTNFLNKSMYNVELYTKYKSKADEKAIQDILTTNGVAYTRTETVRIETEDCFQTVFEFELID